MMNTVLHYEPKGEKVDGLWQVVGSVVLTLGALYAWKTGYVMAIKNFSLGKNSFLIFGILLGLGFVWTLREYISSLKRKKLVSNLSSQEKSITMNEGNFSFPTIKKGECHMITVPYEAVTQLRKKVDEDEGESQVIYINDEYKNLLGKGRFQWFKNNFPIDTEYETFEKILIEKCTNIINR